MQINVRYTAPDERLNLLKDYDWPLPDRNSRDHSAASLKAISKIISCYLHSPSQCESKNIAQCRISANYFKFITLNLGSRITPDLIRAAHLASTVGTPRPGRFRIMNVAVDARHGIDGFVTAKIDVQSHIERLSAKIVNTPGAQKVMEMIYVISVIHPFEDGNGRSLRTLVPICGSTRSQKHLYFWLFFCIFSKRKQKSLSRCLRILHEGSAESLNEFYLSAIQHFNAWNDNTTPNKEESSLDKGLAAMSSINESLF